jgi:dephospho-CoA kinase
MSQLQTVSAPAHLTIAVTGSAGSGKSIVCEQLARRGGQLIDADQVARDVVKPGTEGLGKIIDYFGGTVLTGDGVLDRAALRRRILSDADDRRVLEAMLHPVIIAEMEARMKAAHDEGYAFVVAEVPLLFETGMASRFDKVVLVKADRHIKVRRLTQRDNVSEEDAKRLLDIQIPDDKKEEQSDFVIENNGTLDELIKYVDRLYEMIYFINTVGGKIT